MTQQRKRYEYILAKFEIDTLGEKLNEWGREGWQTVNVIDYGENGWGVVFMRERPAHHNQSGGCGHG